MNNHIAEQYLSLLKKSLINELYLENEVRIAYFVNHVYMRAVPPIHQLVKDFLEARHSPNYAVINSAKDSGDHLTPVGFDQSGRPCPLPHSVNFSYLSHTMIGRKRINNLHQCLDIIRQDNIPGDLIETGVWRGGATIFMNGYLEAYGMTDRAVWVADSFQGLPKPSLPQDADSDISKDNSPYLSISKAEVEELFQRYDLLNDRVKFLEGWFCDTLPHAPIEKLALLRLDGDLYESTVDAIGNLYSKVSPGGFIIVDDYFEFPQCQQAIHEYRDAHHITDEIIPIDKYGVFWRKSV